MRSAGPCPAFREAGGASGLLEEKRAPRTASAELIAHRASRRGKRLGRRTGTTTEENTGLGLPLLLTGWGRMGEALRKRPGRAENHWQAQLDSTAAGQHGSS